ncbi:hypothetical protein ACM55G_14750 [Flavobacterium sp. LB3P122]|uniref:hypothetical protein n=1 Tax=Flavobacterium algoriphilum TaxID=3398738 RepID=UPI003A87A5D0
MSEVIINVDPQEVVVVNITVDENSAQSAMDYAAAAQYYYGLIAGIVAGRTIIPYLELVWVAKGIGNSNPLEEEPGDYFEGFKDSTTYWQKAEWTGGDRSVRTNYIPRIEFEV